MKIVISGLGVMGASLALGIRKSPLKHTLIGHDYPQVMSLAAEKKIIDAPLQRWPDDTAEADLVFLCTPLNVIEEQLKQLAPVISSRTIVTDIGSTKVRLTNLVKELDFRGIYVGGHPMTGAEKSGLSAANHLLYENAVYLLTGISDGIREPVRENLIPVLEAIKSRIMLLDAETHDQIMAAISHVPHLLAIALVNMVGEMEENGKPYFELAAGGFRDMTRVASSSYSIWEDIIMSNRDNIAETMDKLIGILRSQRTRLTDLKEDFKRSNEYRTQLPKVGKGFLAPLTDVLVYVNDEMGVIAKIANALSRRQIDIRDIELLKIREKEGGVFRLSFTNYNEAESAVNILKSINYQAIIRE